MSASVGHSCLRLGERQDYLVVYGSRDTIHVDKAYCQGALRLWQEGEASFREVPVTADILTWLPPVERRANSCTYWEVPQGPWNALACDFVADIEPFIENRAAQSRTSKARIVSIARYVMRIASPSIGSACEKNFTITICRARSINRC